jgi:SNF2 family DNA or RNA helicase
MKARLHNDRIFLSFPYNEATKDCIKETLSGKWHPATKEWSVADSYVNRSRLNKNFGFSFTVAHGKPEQSDITPTSLIKPFDHQIETTQTLGWCYEHQRGLGLFSEAGTGKTKSVIDFLTHYSPAKTLVVCPAPLMYVWVNEAAQHGLKIKKIHGPRRKHPSLESCGVWVTSYDLLRNDLKKWIQHEFDVVVIDESQCVKDHATKRARAARALRSQCKFLLTGTPYANNAFDLWAQMLIACPYIFGTDKWHFADWFVEFGGYEDREVVGIENEELLITLMSYGSIVKRKCDCLDLPPKMYQTIELPMDGYQQDVYDRAAEGAIKDIPLNPLVASSKMRQISSGFYYDPETKEVVWVVEGRSSKIQYLHSIDWSTPTVIWYNFDAELAQISDCLDNLGVPYIDTKNHDSEEVTESFESGEVDVVVAHIKSLQYGVTLNRASRVIYFSPTWSAVERSQSEDRCHRIGQTKSVLYISLVASEVESIMIDALSSKMDVKDYIVKKILDKKHKKQ